MILKTLISMFRCVWLGLELNFSEVGQIWGCLVYCNPQIETLYGLIPSVFNSHSKLVNWIMTFWKMKCQFAYMWKAKKMSKEKNVNGDSIPTAPYGRLLFIFYFSKVLLPFAVSLVILSCLCCPRALMKAQFSSLVQIWLSSSFMPTVSLFLFLYCSFSNLKITVP